MSGIICDPHALAALHARCFLRPPPWDARAFSGLLASPGTFVIVHPAGAGGGGPDGLLVGRVVVDEAELLTLAVSPEMRRQGIARDLTARFAHAAALAGAAQAFLEVASDNAAAQTLYRAQGWTIAGRRRGYYAPDVDAVVMRLTLGHPHEAGQEVG